MSSLTGNRLCHQIESCENNIYTHDSHPAKAREPLGKACEIDSQAGAIIIGQQQAIVNSFMHTQSGPRRTNLMPFKHHWLITFGLLST